MTNKSFFNTLITLLVITLTIFPQKSLQDSSPYVCPYPCLPPPIGGSTYPIPPPSPFVPRPSPPSSTTNCPPPPYPPSGGPGYYYSPPPPPSTGYTPPSYGYNPPSGGYYYPPSGGYYPPSGEYYGNAPPPPNPIMPYFPYYFRNPPPGPQDISIATRLSSLWVVILLLSWLLFLV